MLDCSPYVPEITRCVCSKAVRSLPTTIVTMDLARMVQHRPCRISPFHALLTYLGLLVSLTCPIRMFAQTSVQPGTFGVKLSGYENLVGGGASVGRGGGAGGSTESEVEVTPQYKTSPGTVFAARGVVNLLGDSNAIGASHSRSLTVPELSFFTIGDFR